MKRLTADILAAQEFQPARVARRSDSKIVQRLRTGHLRAPAPPRRGWRMGIVSGAWRARGGTDFRRPRHGNGAHRASVRRRGASCRASARRMAFAGVAGAEHGVVRSEAGAVPADRRKRLRRVGATGRCVGRGRVRGMDGARRCRRASAGYGMTSRKLKMAGNSPVSFSGCFESGWRTASSCAMP